MKKIKVLSLFDGISCAQVALKKLKYQIEYYASETDKFAIEITQKRHPKTIQLGDIKMVDKKMIGGGYTLLIGGSPCQDLSVAKKNRQGLAGKRSGLFYEYLRILREVKPKYFVLENVASMPKDAKEEITKELGVEPIMIDAALVSAQSRKRLFWTNIPNIKLPKDKELFLIDIIHEARNEEVDEKYFINAKVSIRPEKGKSNNKTCIRVGEIGKGGQADRIYSLEGKSVTLSANRGGRGAKTGLYLIDWYNNRLKDDGKAKTLGTNPQCRTAVAGQSILLVKSCASRTYPRTKTPGVKRNKRIEIRKDKKANNITTVQSDSMVLIRKAKTIRVGGRGSKIGDKHNWDTYKIAGRVRKITPIECERLQSLPDNYTQGLSDSQRYKTLGNAFNTNVVKHILKNMKI